MAKKKMSRQRYGNLKEILINMLDDSERDIHAEFSKVRHDDFEPDKSDDDISTESMQDYIEIALAEIKTINNHAIKNALSRLDKGTYGFCEDCNNEISEKRLKAVAFTSRCVSCQEEVDVQVEHRLKSNKKSMPLSVALG